MAQEKEDLFKNLPSVDELMRQPEVSELLQSSPRVLVKDAVRMSLEELREAIKKGCGGFASTRRELSALALKLTRSHIHTFRQNNLRRVINATGVVLHTNLGRSLLAESALHAVMTVGGGYANLELDLATGQRGSRYHAVEGILTRLTGAEAAMVVNNNAAAVLLALNALAQGREVIISRGQLVEIGGSFRIPEVMDRSGAVLVEVGATNKTYPRDYQAAINDNTALLLQVHTSNYRIVGFVRETTTAEMVELGRAKGLPVMCDLGSGCFFDLSPYGLPKEPTVQEVVKAGADVVTFSGDKLLGGPQAGIIVGRGEYIERIKKNPLTRALRIDKLVASALEATLRAYLDQEQALRQIPTLRMLTEKPAALQERAMVLQEAVSERVSPGRARLNIVEGQSRVGGGALPVADLPTYLLEVTPRDISAGELQAKLRSGQTAVIARVQDDRVLFDPRTILPEDTLLLARQIAEALGGGDGACGI